MKECRMCKTLKNFSEFGKHSGRKDGHTDDCKDCRKIVSRQDYERRKEKIKADSNKYYHDNKDVYHARIEKAHREHDEVYYASVENLTKICADCKLEFSLKDFTRDISKADGYKSYCKCCQNKQNREYYSKNPEKENLRSKTYRKNNPEKTNAYQRGYKKRRLKEDTNFHVLHLARVRINNALKGVGKKDHPTLYYLGCSIEEYKQHIQNQFLPGMTWENHGEWEIDHIKAVGNPKTVEQIMVRFHYTNVQPLWKPDNQKKSNKGE